MNTFRAGTLRDRIHILRRIGIRDEWGLPLPQAWENLTPRAIAADVRHNSGLNAIKADADVSVVRASIRIRRRTDVDAGMRVLLGGPLYEIEAIYPGRNGECIDLVCKRIPGHKT